MLGGLYVEIDPAESDLRVRDPSRINPASDRGTWRHKSEPARVNGSIHHGGEDPVNDASALTSLETRPVTTALWPFAVFFAAVLP